MSSSPQHVSFLAQRAGSAFRGEVVDTETQHTLARTSLTYPNEGMAELAARRMWEMRPQRIARTLSGTRVA
jgi:hypothetical protein